MTGTHPKEAPEKSTRTPTTDHADASFTGHGGASQPLRTSRIAGRAFLFTSAAHLFTSAPR